VQNNKSSSTAIVATLSATLIILFFGIWLFMGATLQGQAFTTEALRQAELNEHPKKIPSLVLINADQQPIALAQLSNDHRIYIVDFMYTRCQTVCLSLGSVFQNLQAKILAQGLEKKIGLVSISFDPKNDDAQALQRYEKRMQMQTDVWQAYSLQNPNQRDLLLNSFGIMVIPAPLDEYEHNAALHVLKNNTLYRIFPLDDWENALLLATALNQ
jgi:protein SCO1